MLVDRDQRILNINSKYGATAAGRTVHSGPLPGSVAVSVTRPSIVTPVHGATTVTKIGPVTTLGALPLGIGQGHSHVLATPTSNAPVHTADLNTPAFDGVVTQSPAEYWDN